MSQLNCLNPERICALLTPLGNKHYGYPSTDFKYSLNYIKNLYTESPAAQTHFILTHID
jgi:hypothetical protein